MEISLLVAVLAGAASFLSPCVLPLLPGYVSLMSGYDMAELSEGRVSMRRVVGRTALFVLGFTMVFVALGATATSLSGFLNQSIFTIIAGWVIIAMGAFIVVSAVWTPSWMLPLMKDRRITVKTERRTESVSVGVLEPGSGGDGSIAVEGSPDSQESSRSAKLGLAGPPVMGMAFAFGWTPCIGPFLATALLLGANSDTMYQGMVVLFFYSLGLGIPFLITSLLLTKAFSAFNWIKRYLTQITVVSGLMLALFGVLLVTGRITDLSIFFSDLLLRFGLEEFAVS